MPGLGQPGGHPDATAAFEWDAAAACVGEMLSVLSDELQIWGNSRTSLTREKLLAFKDHLEGILRLLSGRRSRLTLDLCVGLTLALPPPNACFRARTGLSNQDHTNTRRKQLFSGLRQLGELLDAVQTYPGRLRDASPVLREFVATAALGADSDARLEDERTDTTVPELVEQLELLELDSGDDSPAVPPAFPREELEDIDKYASRVRAHLRSDPIPEEAATVQSLIVGTPVPHGRFRVIASLEATSKPGFAKACRLLADRYEGLFFKLVDDDPFVDFPNAALVYPGD